jgi:hypothetical protein
MATRRPMLRVFWKTGLERPERLEDALEAIRVLCEPVEPPRDDQVFYRYFSAAEHGNADQLKENEPKRLSLYKLTGSLLRANIASTSSSALAVLPRSKGARRCWPGTA